MRWLKPQLIWPLITGVLIAIVLLQKFPSLGGQLTQPANIAEIKVGERVWVERQAGPVSYAAAVHQAAPAVVNIYTTKLVQQPSNPFMNDPFFQHFFGRDLQPQRQRLQSSLGSGVLVSSEGYILTNHHVVNNADEIKVALRDGRETLATIIGSDPESDLAVLKIELDNLPAIALASSDTLEVGDVVLAIGNPFGVGQTVTQGIISALGRNSLGINTYEDFIQTDAAINPGNSGGALINPHGQLLGINTAIFSRSGGSQGIGFAIPSNLAKRIMLDLINEGQVVRGWLGIEAQEITPALAQSLRLKNTQGLLIAGVLRQGPGAKSGLRPGDVLIQIDNYVAETARSSLNHIASLKPGTRVELKLIRNGRLTQLTAEIGRRPNS